MIQIMMVTEPGLAHDTADLPWEWGGAGPGWLALAERSLPRAAQPPPSWIKKLPFC